MASTSQSAEGYIRSARCRLVGELKNLSVILENLYQKGVLCDEEVSQIQAEKDDYGKTRKILDSVTKKGEKACYELLKIIDMTRKRTLDRPSLHPGTKTFDLHHWISCFSFKEDTQIDVNYLQGPRPCHRYQEKLKSKAKKISNEFWAASKTLFGGNKKPDLSYATLVLDTEGSVSPSKIKKVKKKKSKLSRPKKLRTYIPEEKPDISPSELLETDKNILLVGKPGIGKTALTHEMLRLWAERESKELDYMFYFDMRETSHIRNAKSLEELLFGGFCEPDEGKDEVLQDMKKYSDNITIIFDGLTDLCSSVVENILKKKLPLAKIIITCRADDEDEDLFSGDFDRVEVKGFSEQTIKTYLSATLGEDQKKVLSNLQLVTLCHVPMYALMVAACFNSDDFPQPCTITEIYINIVRFCLQINSKTKKKKDLNSFISTKKEEILSLAEAAFLASQQKTMILTDLPCKDSCVLSFLKPPLIKVAPTETITTYAFLHYTVQEFFAALWLLKNPDKIRDVFQQCLTEEKKHMKHLIPFMCRLLNEKSPSLLKHLIPDQDLKTTSNWFFKELINTFLPHLGEQEEADTEDILFLCQCLYESQSPEACIYLLDKLDYHLDLSGESLDPYPCCAVAYVVTQSKERKIRLNLEDVIISEQGMRQLFGCLENVEWCDPLPQQQLHLPAEGQKQLFERAVEVMQRKATKVHDCLYQERETSTSQRLCESLLETLPFFISLRVVPQRSGLHEAVRFFVNLFCAAAEREEQTGEKILQLLSLVCTYQTFPLHERDMVDDKKNYHSDVLLDLYSHVKDCETKTGLSVFPSLQSVFQSTPAVWSINLSERKTSILLEVLKLQPEKKHVELTGCSHEESEVRSFIQCLPYISQLSVFPQESNLHEAVRFFGNLFCAAAEREEQTGEKILDLLSSLCRYQTFPLQERDMNDYYQCNFLLDLYSHVTDYANKTGLSVLPSLFSVIQSAPAVLSINLSERKTSILLEVLKLQTEKKQVELTDCSHEESEVRSFLQCLPYISQLSVDPWRSDLHETVRFFVNLFCAAAEREEQTGEKILELLSSVCRYQTFPLHERYIDDYYCSDVLLDLYSHVKDYETKTGLSVLPSLQSVFQSAPAVWSISLLYTDFSILLEVLKLQPEKKQVKLTVCSHDESEVRSFLQCLPYISQLSVDPWLSDLHEAVRFFVNLFFATAEREEQTGEKILQLLSSVCTYQTFPFNTLDDDGDKFDLKKYKSAFLLDLYSHVKDCETKTGLSVLPSLQSVFQSAPAVWPINLSERKTSTLLEVLKLQTEKKQVDLTGCSHEESEVRSFRQCLPYISQLRSEGAQTKELEMDMLAIQSATSSIGDSEVRLGPNTPDTNPKDVTKLLSSFIPEVQNESAQISYRFKCSGSGLFHCILTGLVFDMTREAELLYKIIQWDESVLQRVGKMAAGPLFDIKCCEDAVRQLHFPHCETQKALLSVVHFTDDTMSFIKPLKITDTHVVIETPHFSAFGPVVDLDNAKPVKGQILLFLRPPNSIKKTQNLDVLLLPRNIPLDQVSRHHQRSHFILVPSACNLIKNQIYTVHCPVACKIQPKKAEFDMEFGPNYPPTFLIRLPMNTEEITLTIRDQTDAEVWEHEVDLTDHLPFSADGRIPAQEIMVMLLDILQNLSDDVFSDFKWHLKIKTWNGMTPIKESDLSEAKRTTTVDLMVQKYQITGAVQVMELILKTISRNDLVEKLLTLRH